jgi:hypothetical protein
MFIVVGESLCEDGASSTAAHTQAIHSSHEMIDCLRLVALDVVDDYRLQCKIISCTKSIYSSIDSSHFLDSMITVRLAGQWYGAAVAAGDTFHVISFSKLDLEFSQTIPYGADIKDRILVEINDEQGLFVLHPDTLLSPTRIAESCSCLRRGVISERIRLFGEHSAAAALGNAKHSLIEELMTRMLPRKNHADDDSALNSLIDQALSKHAEELYAVGINDDAVRHELRSVVNPLKHWMNEFCSAGISLLTDKQENILQRSLVLQSVNSLEETIWSPALGIKGQLDATITCVDTYKSEGYHHSSFNQLADLPLEIKTGKWRPISSLTHRAQVWDSYAMLSV